MINFINSFHSSFITALNNRQIIDQENTESPEESESVFVMNVSSPPPTFKNKRNLIYYAKHIMSNDIYELAESTNDINMNIRPSINIPIARDFHHISNAPGHQLNFEGVVKECYENNLAHPSWYFGFWRDTHIIIEGEKLDPNRDATLKFTFGNLNEPKPVIKYVVTANGIEEHEIKIADYIKKDDGEPFPPSGILKHLIGAMKKDKRDKDATGWLLVWNADTWKCQLARDTINYHDYDFDGDYGWEDHNYNYICPDLFDYITISIDSRNEFAITALRIVLNDVIIYEKRGLYANPPTIRRYQPIILDKMIQNYKHKSLVYHHDRSPDDPSVGYSKSRILQNKILSLASYELGQSWSPKYAPEARWPEENTLTGDGWTTAPENWCADFAGWLIEQANPSLPISEVPFNLAEFPDYFKRKTNYFCPSNTAYEDLGNVIEPGFVVSMRQGGHTVIFLYWMGYIGPIENCSAIKTLLKEDYQCWDSYDAENIAKWIKDAKDNLDDVYAYNNPDPPPGRFEPDAPVNWFVVINGNSGGGRVKKSLIPVVNLRKRSRLNMNGDALTTLFGDAGKKAGIEAVLYSEIGSWKNSRYSKAIVRYEDGFGDTNGFSSGFHIGNRATGFHQD